MREILFRGKRIDNGEWVYGYYICKQDPFLPGIDTNVIVTFDENSMSVWNKVDPATIGQYTGLTDKNGVKIFEWDIAKTKTTSCEFLGEVVYSPQYVRFISTTKSELEFPMDGRFEYEVIGNIHDNPELLK